MKPLFEISSWSNQYATGYEYSFLWGKLIVDYEYSHGTSIKRPWLPSYLQQWGGDHIYLWSFGWFRRSLDIRVWEL